MEYKDKVIALLNSKELSEEQKEKLGEIFPELKENEDERIRKVLLNDFKNNCSEYYCEGVNRDMIIAWLEKQGNLMKALQFANKTIGEITDENYHLREKLNEQKPYGQREECFDCQCNYAGECKGYCGMKRGEQNYAEKVEPKFKVGDWTVSNLDKKARRISEVHFDEYNSYYVVDGKSVNLEEYDRLHHLWAIQEAKAGDVLVNQNGEMPFIFKECKDNHIYGYCGYTNRKDIFFDRFVDSKGEELHWLNLYYEQVYPATKEQRDLLFKKMKEAGYEWNADKKKLKKDEIMIKAGRNYRCIKTHKYAGLDWLEGTKYYADEDYSLINNGCTCFCPKYSKYEHNNLFEEVECDDCVEKQYEQKPSWSEDDDYNLQCMIAKVTSDIQKGNVGRNNELIDWLKFLKNRVQPQPKQDWSEEDESHIRYLIECLEYCKKGVALTMSTSTSQEYINWLKSLRPQSTWKPSESQLERMKLFD